MSKRSGTLSLVGAMTLLAVGCGAGEARDEDGVPNGGSVGASNAGAGGEGGIRGGGFAGSGRSGTGGSSQNQAGSPSSGGSGTAGGSIAGSGGSAAGGTAGSTTDGGAGGVAGEVGSLCAGDYDSSAPWPGAGRCASRSGYRAEPGPTKLLSVRSVGVGAPITTSPVVGAAHVFVATDQGLLRFDRPLEASSKVVRFTGKFGASPVLASGRVYAISRDGMLHFGSQDGTEPAQKLPLALASDVLADPGVGWASSPVLGAGILLVASPFGDIVRVQLGAVPKVLPRVSTPGAAAGGALTLDDAGAAYLPTSLGVFRVSADGQGLQRFGESAVATPPIATGLGVLFADVTGQLHRVAVPASGVGAISAFAGAKLDEAPGPFADLGAQRYSVATGKSLQLVTINDTSGSAGPVVDAPDGDTFYTTSGAVVAAPAVDVTGRQYVASSDGTLYVLDAGGTLVDSFLTEGSLLAQPALVAGGLYLGSTDGKVYHFTDQASPPPGGSGGASGASGSAGASGAGGLSGAGGQGNGGNGGSL